MKCPKCGSTIEDGMFLCSKCGYEINYVPDYEPEIETKIERSLSRVASGVSEQKAGQRKPSNPAKKSQGGSKSSAGKTSGRTSGSGSKPGSKSGSRPGTNPSGSKASGHAAKPASRPVTKSNEGELDEELLRRYGLDDHTSRLPTQEIPVEEIKKRIPTQEIDQNSIRSISGDAKKKKTGTGGAANRPATKTKPGAKPAAKTAEKHAPKKKSEFDDEFDDDFWDVEEALDFSGAGKFFAGLRDNVAARIIAIIVAVVVIALGAVIGINIYKNVKKNSFEYKYEQAVKAYDAGDYAHAVTYMEQASVMKPKELSLQYQLAEYYQKNNQTQNAILTYRNIIRDFDSDIIVAYTKLFAIYESVGDFESINKVLGECTDQTIVTQFQQYLADPPEFSMAPGAYDDPIYLKINANTTGKVYYTLDGSTPDNESLEYTTPLYLEKGAFFIRAIYINSYGLMSPVAEGDFSINVQTPDPPEVNLDSDEYDKPEIIIVEAPEDCVVYYTTDGSEPTKDSNIYKNPILMPIGSSVFMFVTYNFDDVPSEVLERDYVYKPDESVVSAAMAADIAKAYRISLGGNVDEEGNVSTPPGRLLFLTEYAIDIRGTVYYVVNEYFQDLYSGSMAKTNYSVYAVNSKDPGDYGVLTQRENGDYVYQRVSP